MEGLRECIADIVNFLNWESSSVKCSLWANDLNIFSVIHNFANEWDILHAENGQVLFFDHLISKHSLNLPIKSTLSKDGTDDGSLLDVWFNLC